mmetsp:Transcript_8256/g.34522  ORF Transcript_8256/g.34522 Transcript_8256/m.34522 type:complete len:363 (-) Transcript_8256:1390-2478(-)
MCATCARGLVFSARCFPDPSWRCEEPAPRPRPRPTPGGRGGGHGNPAASAAARAFKPWPFLCDRLGACGFWNPPPREGAEAIMASAAIFASAARTKSPSPSRVNPTRRSRSPSAPAETSPPKRAFLAPACSALRGTPAGSNIIFEKRGNDPIATPPPSLTSADLRFNVFAGSSNGGANPEAEEGASSAAAAAFAAAACCCFVSRAGSAVSSPRFAAFSKLCFAALSAAWNDTLFFARPSVFSYSRKGTRSCLCTAAAVLSKKRTERIAASSLFGATPSASAALAPIATPGHHPWPFTRPQTCCPGEGHAFPSSASTSAGLPGWGTEKLILRAVTTTALVFALSAPPPAAVAGARGTLASSPG